MRMLTFAGRNTKEILRDPLNLAFGLGFPLVLILWSLPGEGGAAGWPTPHSMLGPETHAWSGTAAAL